MTDLHAATPPLPETRCPLCGGPNDCVPAATGSFAEPCWCRDGTFPAPVLARVPSDKVRRACVCRQCAQLARGGTTQRDGNAP